jgi:hypothetical protein
MTNKIVMAKKRILAACLGHRDLRAFASISHPALKNEILVLVKGELPPGVPPMIPEECRLA